MPKMNVDNDLLIKIADGITQLRTWYLISTEVEVPDVYTFNYKNKDYTLEAVEGHYLLNKRHIVAVCRSDAYQVSKHLQVFEDKEAWSNWAEYASASANTKIVSGEGTIYIRGRNLFTNNLFRLPAEQPILELQ